MPRQQPPARRRFWWLDPWLALFVLLALGSSLISAHGALEFFKYLVDDGLAILCTAVLAFAIVGLDAAGTLERSIARRWLYFGGMFIFLVMETLANYFSAQAVFSANVRTALGTGGGSDLLWVVQEEPFWTRVLVVLFLALPSATVAYFTFAAASRLRALQDLRYRRISASRLDQLRALIKRLARGWREARRQLAEQSGAFTAAREGLTAAEAELADARGQRAALAAQAGRLLERRDWLAGLLNQRRALIKRLARRLAESREERQIERQRNARHLEAARDETEEAERRERETRDELTGARRELAEARETARRFSRELESARASAVPTRAAILAYVARRMAEGAARAEVARELGIAEGTLRTWQQEAERPAVGAVELNGKGH